MADDGLTGLFARYEQAMQAELYSEASDAAADYIKLFLRDPEHDRRDWADALVRLGNAQRLATNYDSAIVNYQLAVDILVDDSDHLDAALIDPMQGMAEAMLATRQFNGAADVLETVVHLRQVNFGLNDADQCDALDELSRIYLMLGDDKRALARQQARLGVIDQHYPGDDLRKLPALFGEAEFLAETGRLYDSHRSYRRIIAMIERADGTRSPELLGAFYRISELIANNVISDGYDGTYMARRYLRRAIHIADKNDTITPRERADAYIAMGDFLASHTPDRDGAMRRYRKAWQILAADEQSHPELEARFSEPRLLNELPLQTSPIMKNLMASLEYREPVPGASVLVRFDVAADGLPKNLQVVEGDPDGYWDSLVVDHVQKFVFRPKLEDGEPVASPGLHWNVPYLAQDEDLLD